MKQKSIAAAIIAGLLIFCLMCSSGLYIALKPLDDKKTTELPFNESAKLTQFGSQSEFLQYLQDNDIYSYNKESNVVIEESISFSPGVGNDRSGELDSNAPYGTYIQVKGVDEPDFLKADGKKIYIAPNNYYYSNGRGRSLLLEDSRVASPTSVDDEIKIIESTDPSNTDVDDVIESKANNLLLSSDNLIALEASEIKAYSRSDYKQVWQLELGRDIYYSNSRIIGDKLIVIANQYLGNDFDGCAKPMLTGAVELSLICDDIYYWPGNPVQTLSHIFVLNAQNGNLLDSTSISSDNNSTLYVTADSIYLASRDYASKGDVQLQMIAEVMKAIVTDQSVIDKVDAVMKLDISVEAKMVEIEQIATKYAASLSAEEMRNLENDSQEIAEEIAKKYLRKLAQTNIAKLNLDDLGDIVQGKVPGYLLSQFSLDEHEGNLRVAVSINGNTSVGASVESTNDMYVFNDKLEMIGEVRDFGLTERIYSVRFMGDTAYVVTFRQIDPFYIMDLSNPRQPKITGELKIPGYSSFLHKINDDVVVGVGREDNKLKVSLFDVSDKTDPRELDTYYINNEYSELEYSHKGFGINTDKELLYVPAANGYFIGYGDNELILKKQVAVSNGRALLIEDNYWVVGQDEIIVVRDL